jgi:hypothetical protein
MASGNSMEGEIKQGLAAVLDRVASFFDLFDLSFLVSGAVAISAFHFLCRGLGLDVLPSFDGKLFVAVLILASYVAGLLCFAAGRGLRRLWNRRIEESSPRHESKLLLAVLQAHGLDETEPVKGYLARKGDPARLYARLWAELRGDPSLRVSYALCQRYWVMAATCDGLAFAFLLWSLALGASACCLGRGVSSLLVSAAVVAFVLALVVSREAGRYTRYQMEELVASLAVRASPTAPTLVTAEGEGGNTDQSS